MDIQTDRDPLETQEWRDALAGVLAFEGPDRARFLLEELIAEARRQGAPVPFSATTPYLNTIPPGKEERHPGDRAIEHRIRSLIRWNAVATVLRANKVSSELGGHIASFQSAARSTNRASCISGMGRREHGGDLVYFQGHSSPGFYARAFWKGGLTEEQMLNFRQEVDGQGISSYPHPWLMPRFLAVPHRVDGPRPADVDLSGAIPEVSCIIAAWPTRAERKVWAFLGDGETDEPESLGAIAHGRAGAARQSDLRHQLQSAAPRRAGARQRQDHPGAGRQLSAAPAGT